MNGTTNTFEAVVLTHLAASLPDLTDAELIDVMAEHATECGHYAVEARRLIDKEFEARVAEARTCIRCKTARSVGSCCSSHDKQLCHLCYRRTHFVELCVAGCRECAAEELPVNLRDLQAVAS